MDSYPSVLRPQWEILAASAVAVAHTGDTVETILATIPIPAGAMGANGALRINLLVSYTNSANNKIIRGRLGGIGGTAFISSTLTTTALAKFTKEIANTNSAAAQVSENAGQFGPGTTSSGVGTGTVNTAIAQDFVFTAQLALGTETLTLIRYMVEIFKKP